MTRQISGVFRTVVANRSRCRYIMSKKQGKYLQPIK